MESRTLRKLIVIFGGVVLLLAAAFVAFVLFLSESARRGAPL